jgi:putative amidoligase enzyme
VIRIYSRWERAIDSFMAPSRRWRGVGYRWCQALDINWDRFEAATTMTQLSTACGIPAHVEPRSAYRYRKINLLAFRQHGTIEFRQHQGTVDPQKTEMWVKLLLRMSHKATMTNREEISSRDNNLEALLTFLECTDAEKQYFIDRRNHFAAAA